jgi:PhoPQ-activated pathogenicity-related protein
MNRFSLVASRRRGLLFAFALMVLCGSTARAQETALDRYIAKPDSSYAWKQMTTMSGQGYKATVIELTSQTWRSASEVDRPVWRHWLIVVKPEQITHDTALLFIGGGSNKDPMPTSAPERLVHFALESQSVVAELRMVPNQPLTFADSPDQHRVEDDLVAYSRVRQMQSGDDNWLVRLAMVKSGVRALDAIQEFMASEAGGRVRVRDFVVSGGSKRGWTTWLVAAVDRRVRAIMPVVIDALNSEQITRHQFEAYGFFSQALEDYVRHKIFPDKIGTPEYQHILAIEDPFNYLKRERLRAMPKYMVNASGDQFFLPDNSQFYYSRIEGEKYLRYVPNAKHNMEGTDAAESLLSFYTAVLNNVRRPQFAWKKEKDGALTVTVKDKPSEVNLWQATNPDARDFRVDTIGKAYTRTTLKEERAGVYVGRVEKPARGYTAFFVELVYASGGKTPFKFTTEVSVVPDVLPFKWEDAKKSQMTPASKSR